MPGPLARGSGMPGPCPLPTVDRFGQPYSNTPGYTVGMSKVMISLPEQLLAEIDAEAGRRSTSRSALLAAAARRELARRDSAEVAAAIARSERRFSSAGTFEASEVVRTERDSRG